MKFLRSASYVSAFDFAACEIGSGMTIFLTILTEFLLGNPLSAEKESHFFLLLFT